MTIVNKSYISNWNKFEYELEMFDGWVEMNY